ncbi:MAG: response regulator [Nitrospirae bacterium]|nr:response regulator [Nitrospirota bacterium]
MAKQILLADDSAAVRKHLTGILQGAGYHVTEAQDGMEVLEKLKPGGFDLLILDLQMPQLSGFEVLRIVKAGGAVKTLPVLCITGVHKDLTDVHKLRELGADGYIQKDTPAEDLLFRVKKAVEARPS